ncbi:MAG: AAA family ATPase [Clostridia bacterium]|nr:AAA family ATPase [Clostridia bacterium]
MKKILVIGCPGAGKSTFARRLRDETGLPLYHLDMIWHKPDKTNISREGFDEKLSEILDKDEWIIDGNYDRTLEVRFKRCDTVFLLDLPTEVCLQGVRNRIGKKRDDMPWVEDELDEEFKTWILDFPKKTLPHTYELIEKYRDKNVIVFKSHNEIDNYRIREEK